jgi:hypothetical protein
VYPLAEHLVGRDMPMLIRCPLPIFMSLRGIEEFGVFYPEAKVGLMRPRSSRPHEHSVRAAGANTNCRLGIIDGGVMNMAL